MKRNKNLDIVRALAVLAVVIYHISVITNINIPIKPLQDILNYGGEFGVTIFFILSGFAIYSSMKRSGKDFKYHNFITKRLSRILPQYYISLIILLLFTNMAVYLNMGNIGNIFSHIFLFHDWYPSFQGAISGVCWTLGVIFQFYLISPLIFYCIEKKPKLTMLFSVIFSIAVKAFIYHFIIAKSINGDLGVAYYFGLGRTIVTALDTFVIGMFLGRYVKVPEDNKKIIFNIIGLVISTSAFIAWIYVAKNNVLYSDSIVGYIWHTVLAIVLAVMMYFFANIKLPLENPVLKALLFISKYEYGIYIWHLLMINALCSNSEIIMQYIVWQRKITYVILLGISIASGVLMTEIIDNINFKEMYLKLRTPIINTAKVCGALILCLIFYKVFKILPEICSNYVILIDSIIVLIITSIFYKKLNVEKLTLKSVIIYTVSILIVPIGYSVYKIITNFPTEFGIHLEYIILLMQNITIKFYSNIFAVVLMGIIIGSMYITYHKLDKKDKTYVLILLFGMLANIIYLILGYIISGEKAVMAEEFNRDYTRIIMIQVIASAVLLKPIFLKEKQGE